MHPFPYQDRVSNGLQPAEVIDAETNVSGQCVRQTEVSTTAVVLCEPPPGSLVVGLRSQPRRETIIARELIDLRHFVYSKE